MRDVDTLNALVSYYRTTLRLKKSYLRLFFHFADLVVVTDWFLYRRDCDYFVVSQSKRKD